MSKFDVLGMCLRNLIKRKLRTFLTVLGVMIGTASIVLMISLGLAINEQFARQLENMDVDLTVIQLWDYGGWGQPDNQMTAIPKLDDRAMHEFEKIPGVVVATPIMQGNLHLKAGKYYWGWAQIMGMKPRAMELLGYVPAEGRLLQEGDQYDVVFGAMAEKNFQDPGFGGGRGGWDDRYWRAWQGEETDTYVNIFKDKIRMSYDSRFIWDQESSSQEYDAWSENAPKVIKPFDLKVVGLLERRNDWTIDFGIFMDIDLLKELMALAEKANKDANKDWGHYSALRGGRVNTTYQQAFVKTKDINHTKSVYDKIIEMGYNGWYPAQSLDSMREMMQGIQILLAAIGAVSLFVAAIGIANTMIMAIYERTREIGVMKVIGAAIRDIKWLFLLESALLGFFGGVFGVGLSLLASYILNNADISLFGNFMYYFAESDGNISLITPWLCGVALAFASVVGLVSGYFPARRAMRLSALSAIRTE